jgi:hypothetical protein
MMPFRNLKALQFTKSVQQRSFLASAKRVRNLRNAPAQSLPQNLALAKARLLHGIIDNRFQFRLDSNLQQ